MPSIVGIADIALRWTERSLISRAVMRAATVRTPRGSKRHLPQDCRCSFRARIAAVDRSLTHWQLSFAAVRVRRACSTPPVWCSRRWRSRWSGNWWPNWRYWGRDLVLRRWRHYRRTLTASDCVKPTTFGCNELLIRIVVILAGGQSGQDRDGNQPVPRTVRSHRQEWGAGLKLF